MGFVPRNALLRIIEMISGGEVNEYDIYRGLNFSSRTIGVCRPYADFNLHLSHRRPILWRHLSELVADGEIKIRNISM